MDGIEALPAKSEFFDQVFEENQRLFFEPVDVNEEGAVQDTVLAADESDLIKITTTESPSDVLDTAPNRRKSWRPVAMVGSAALFFAGLIVLAVETQPSQPQQSSSPSELSISLRSLPNRLPTAVKARVGDVGIVEDEIYASQDAAAGTDYESARWANGVQIRPNLALAGGGLFSYSSAELNSSTQCQQVTFTTGLSRDFLAMGYGTTPSRQASKTPELEALGLPQDLNDYPFTNTPENITIAPRPPRPGEDLFLVNYENEANGLYYDMNNDIGPAVYGGIYVGTYSNGSYEVLTGLKSYGHNLDSSSRDGSEDGAIFNEKGQLVALSGYYWATKSSSVRQYEKWDGVKLTSDAPKKLITDTYVQPVSKSLADKYEQKEQPITQDCFPEAMAG